VLAALVVTLSLLGLGACGNQTPTEFNADVKKAFLDGCNAPVNNAKPPKGACDCAYGKLSKDKSQFDAFKKANDRLQQHPDESLPSGLYSLVKSCAGGTASQAQLSQAPSGTTAPATTAPATSAPATSAPATSAPATSAPATSAAPPTSATPGSSTPASSTPTSAAAASS